MVLKCGSIIPFQYKDVKKLLVVAGEDKTSQPTICDVKNAVRSAFTIYNCEFYNKKIGFKIPDELLIPYLEQRHDLANFVIEIVEEENILTPNEEQTDYKPPDSLVLKLHSTITNESKRNGEDLDVIAPVVKKSKQTLNIDAHLEDILKTSEGQAMWHNFKSSNRLTDNDRQLIVKLVTNYELQNILLSNFPLAIANQRYLALAAAIVRKFPCEDATTYYVPHCKTEKRIAGGKLYDHFSAIKCLFLAMEGDSRYCNSDQEIVEADFPELDNLLQIIGDWGPYFKAWQQTFELRMAYVRNIDKPFKYFEKFIANVDENAIELVEFDFEKLYPEKGNKLVDNWDQMSERIFTEAIVCGRNDVPLILDLYGNMPQLSGFIMLGYLLENFETDVKAFEKDSPSNLVVHIETVDGKPLDVFKEYRFKHNQLDPMVFVTGKKTDELSFFVLVGDSLYCMETALKAVDFCFKCYQVLQLSYPKQRHQVWQVIQSALYDIHKDEDDPTCENFLNIFKSS